jgi:hypothetical protein
VPAKANQSILALVSPNKLTRIENPSRSGTCEMGADCIIGRFSILGGSGYCAKDVPAKAQAMNWVIRTRTTAATKGFIMNSLLEGAVAAR